jgi:hypothetical protein
VKHSLAVVFACAFACAPIRAQNPTPVKAVPHDLGAVAQNSPQIAAMKSALRNLTIAEEKFWSTHGTYTTDGSVLGLFPAASGQPLAQVIFAGSRGWKGMVSDRSLKGKSCVIFVGSENELPGGVPKTMAAGIAAKEEGMPTCDVP